MPSGHDDVSLVNGVKASGLRTYRDVNGVNAIWS